MKIKVDVSDSLKRFSEFEVEAQTIPEARMIARNLHILEHYSKYSKDKLPLIFTEINNGRSQGTF